MKYIQGQNRNQTCLFPVSLDDSIDLDNEVRIIDLFVSSLKLEGYGFKVVFVENGRPAYHPADLLKLYIYGYLNKVRSARDLEKESKRNIEVMWLLNRLSPDHNTISNFRRDNSKAINKVFRETVRIAKYFNLIGGTLLAGDSTKLRAQNSKKNNFNQGKIDRHLAYIECKLAEYNKALAENDGDNKKKAEQEIEKHTRRKDDYKKLEQQLKETGEAQVSTSDPDSRQMIIRNNITEVAYNVQTTVDAKYNIPIDYKVTNHNDKKAMGNMLQRAKSILHTNEFTALYDKGYHTGSEFDMADKLGINVMVAIPGKSTSSQAPDPAYNVENFIYNEKDNTYTCPQGHTLTTNGTWHKSDSGSRFQQYKTRNCKACPVRERCTKARQNGKIVQRRKFADNIEANRQRIENNKSIYKKCQAIVEHPYGTIKRQWGFSYIMTKKYIHRANADVGFMMTAYNLRRLINIIGIQSFKEYLIRMVNLLFVIFDQIRFEKRLFEKILSQGNISKVILEPALKRLYLTHKLNINRGF
ncbi:MAG: IS1182 family transposase [Anaerolineaceae bacterium]|nr:IS1182 family transposase [Anaerolineaceae bacterium]